MVSTTAGYRSVVRQPKRGLVNHLPLVRYDEDMKKPLLTLIVVAVMVAIGFKIYKAMTVEVPVEDQG